MEKPWITPVVHYRWIRDITVEGVESRGTYIRHIGELLRAYFRVGNAVTWSNGSL